MKENIYNPTYMEYMTEMSTGLIEAIRSDWDRELSDARTRSEETDSELNSRVNNYEYLLIG